MKWPTYHMGKIGFRGRLRFGMILVITLVAALSMGASIYLQVQGQTKSLEKLGNYIAVNLSMNSELAILSEEATNVQAALNAALSENQVIGVYIYLPDGELLASRVRKGLMYTLTDFNSQIQSDIIESSDATFNMPTTTVNGRNIHTFFAKIMVEKPDDDIFNIESKQDQYSYGGFVRVDMSLSELAAKKADIFYKNLMLMPIYTLFGIAVIGMIFSLIVEKQITRPLNLLEEAARGVSRGDFSQHIDITTQDEFGSLASSFNNMSAQLSKTIYELNSANETLEKTNTELEEFNYIVSHDLQEPLRKVHSFGQFLMEDCGEQLSEEGKSHVERMQNASVKMKQLIQDLLKLSRITTTEKTYTPVNMNEVIARVRDDLSMAIDESNAQLTSHDLPTVIGNRTQLTQLFFNLIGNAIKYRSDERTLYIDISYQEKDDEVIFAIADNGIGIEPRYFDKIFGVFQRLHRDEQKYKGTGIGLALCKKVVNAHGGRIWAESEHGKGTTFFVSLKKAN